MKMLREGEGRRGPGGDLLHLSRLLLQQTDLFYVDIEARPIMRRRGVALAGGVLGEKNIAGAEIHARPIAKPDIDVAGERDYPTAPGRAVVVDDMRREIVAKHMTGGRSRVVEELRRFARVELLEMGFAVGAGVQAVEFHAASVLAVSHGS
jgi:hypothetical protein